MLLTALHGIELKQTKVFILQQFILFFVIDFKGEWFCIWSICQISFIEWNLFLNKIVHFSKNEM